MLILELIHIFDIIMEIVPFKKLAASNIKAARLKSTITSSDNHCFCPVYFTSV